MRMWVRWVLLVVVGGIVGCGSAPGMKSPDAAAPAAMETSASGEGMQQAEATTWQRSRIVPHTSKLMVGDTESLPLGGFQAKVSVDGFRARVVIDFYFNNPNDRQLEGTFKVRLPDGSSPYFFAFGQTLVVAGDEPRFLESAKVRTMAVAPEAIMTARAESWSGPREARMVPREQAAIAYGETVRRVVDPALMEWSGGGVFSARVFPIAAHKQYRVVLGYDVDLVPIDNDLELRFDLPEDVKAVIDVDVADIAGTRVTPEAKPERAKGRSYYRFDRPKERAVVVRLAAPPVTALTSGDYFAVAAQPRLAAVPSRTSERAVLLVDTSLSSNPDAFNVWLALLRELLESNRDSLKEFAVLFFNVETTWWRPQFVANTPESVAELMRDTKALALEGATDLGAALRQAARPSWLTGADAFDLFLLSDGDATWGESDVEAMAVAVGARAVFAYRTGLSGGDTAALEQLTRNTGGAVFSVTGESELAAAAKAHRSRPWRIRGVELEGTSDPLLAGAPRALFPGQRLTLVGRGTPAPQAAVALRLIDPSGGEKTVRVPIGRVLPSELASRTYGQVAVAQLEELDEDTSVMSKAYAAHFRVTGKTCSLLMLETEEDYARHGIAPEDDALFVKNRAASPLITSVRAARANSVGDPKASFMRWLDKLAGTPGVTLRVPKNLRTALDELPRETFSVTAKPLQVKARRRAELPATLVKQLGKHDIGYDELTREADRRRKAHGPGDALKALSSLVEENSGDAVLARDVAYAAMGWGLDSHAYHLFRRVAVARPYEPQSFHGMARALSRMGRADLAIAYYEIGLAGQWDARFGELRTIIAFDYMRLLRRIASGDVDARLEKFARARQASVARELGVKKADLVVMITWNTDNTDVDLHVTEPSGEECFYSHPRTKSGGSITKDVTQGYGPEMYVLPDAEGGEYRVRVKYFASDANRLSARTKVHVTIIEGFGRAKERVTEKTVTLATGKEMHAIATLQISPNAVVAR